MRRVAFLRGGTAAGIYDLRRLQIGRCGGLRKRALLAPDCCPCYPTFCPPSKKDDQIILLFVQVTGDPKEEGTLNLEIANGSAGLSNNKKTAARYCAGDYMLKVSEA